MFRAHETGELAVTSIRPGHTYGEGGNNLIHSLPGNFYVNRIRKGLPIIVHGDGSSFWPTCHRDDVAVAFVGALGNDKALGTFEGQKPIELPGRPGLALRIRPVE